VTERPADDWLDGRAAAVIFNIAFEAWEEGTTSGIGPMGNPLPADAYDGQAASWGDYGMKRGIWRLIDVFAAHAVKATVMTSAVIAERLPAAVTALGDEGHDVCGHSYAQNLLHPLLSPERERDVIHRSRDLLGDLLGRHPRGWISPRCTPGPATIGLLAEAGFEWHSDCFDADLPYWEDLGGPPILAIPFDVTINDLPFHVRFGNPPHAYVELFERTLDAVVRDGSGGLVDVTVHAHVFGRAPGAAAIDEILAIAGERDDIRVLTRSDVRDRWTRSELGS
jgi:peptidoglycan/xylan/chitin deacetylase (PgdA/CDA1 family)